MHRKVAFMPRSSCENATSRFKEEFGDDLDDKSQQSVALDQIIHVELEHNLGVVSKNGGFTKRNTVEIEFSASSPRPKVTFSAAVDLTSTQIERVEVCQP